MLLAKFMCERAEMVGEDEHITLDAVYSDDPSDPNHVWSTATPFGRLDLVISNPAAQGRFERGREYLMRIEDAEVVGTGPLDVTPPDVFEPGDQSEFRDDGDREPDEPDQAGEDDVTRPRDAAHKGMPVAASEHRRRGARKARRRGKGARRR